MLTPLRHPSIAAATLLAAATAHAGFVGFETTGAYVNGKFVCRVYAQFDSANDVLLSCAGIQGFAGSNWNDADFANGTWSPKFTTDPNLDSFVTIGGVTGFANSTQTGPNWGVSGFEQPGIPNGAVWFNSAPENLQGKVDPLTLRTLIAQFVYFGDPNETYVSPLNISFNQGLGTPTQFASGSTFTVHIPAPAALSLAGLALVVGRGRRRRS